jgi:hypothetical protein
MEGRYVTSGGIWPFFTGFGFGIVIARGIGLPVTLTTFSPAQLREFAGIYLAGVSCSMS